jgi:predicted P-loop ATPase
VEQLKAGGGSWSYAMRLCIESAAVPSYNPVRAYLDGCPQWDGHDHIGDLARRVPTSWERWPEFFHRWVLAMVAQARGMSTMGNSMVPLLIGGQGLRKTTFCRSILPPELREYFMDDIKMDSAEQVERVLARMWLVCIDEYNAKTPREQAKIKRLLTEKDVQVRRPRSDEYRLVPRLASFIATTNDPTPLPSGDGTRRYLCVEVEGAIDMGGAIDHRQLFAQALAELQQEGSVWWFTADDEAAIQEHNRPFQQASPLETVLPSLFEPTLDRRRENLWQVQAVQKVLAARLRTADVPNLRQLSDAMKALRWPQGAVCGQRGYYLKMRNEE